MDDPPFREVQRFRQRWLWALILGVGLVTALPTFGLGALVVGAVAVLVYRCRLTTEVNAEAIEVQFAPFHRSPKRIRFDEIDAVDTERVGLLSYGGLGIRLTGGAVAYLATTGDAVRLVRPNGREVVIGTDRLDALVDAIEAGRRTAGGERPGRGSSGGTTD
jgi:hypothetical protein